ARDALALVNNRYRAGTASLLDVLTAQTTAYTAERTYLTIVGRQYTTSAVLIKALGGGWHIETENASNPAPVAPGSVPDAPAAPAPSAMPPPARTQGAAPVAASVSAQR
ncbi:rnd efflux system, outer membrane lipoprotein, partial [Cupriavidus basilensis OR16]